MASGFITQGNAQILKVITERSDFIPPFYNLIVSEILNDEMPLKTTRKKNMHLIFKPKKRFEMISKLFKNGFVYSTTATQLKLRIRNAQSFDLFIVPEALKSIQSHLNVTQFDSINFETDL